MTTSENGREHDPAASENVMEDDARSVAQQDPRGNQVEPNSTASVAFLHFWAPDGPWDLTAFYWDKRKGRTRPPQGRTFRLGEEQGLAAWIVEWNRAGYNIHFSVAELGVELGPKRAKADKEEISACVACHVDADPVSVATAEEDCERFERLATEGNPHVGLPPATLVLLSGRGVQAFWRLREPATIEEVEARNRWLAVQLGADKGTHNADRVMKLPGTIAWVSNVKQAKGWPDTPVVARLLPHRGDRVGVDAIPALHEATQAPPPARKRAAPVAAGKPFEDVWDIPGLGPAGRSPAIDRLAVVIVHGLDPDEPNRHPSRSEWVLYVACQMLRLRLEPEDVYRTLLSPVFGISESVLEQKRPEAYARRQVDRAMALVGPARPRIDLNQDLPDVVDAFEDALLLSERVTVYQSGTELTRVGRIRDSKEVLGIESPVGQLRMMPVSLAWLYEQSWRVAEWTKWSKSEEKDVKAAPDRLAPATYMARVGEWRLPHLHAIVSSPQLLLDGTVVDEPGWHPSGVLYEPEGVQYPAVPDQPSREDARAALDLIIREALPGFPFVPDQDEDGRVLGSSAARSVALSAILTGIIRPQLPQAPLHGFDATTPGTGKSYLLNTVSHIVSGRPPAMMTYTPSEEENEKRWLATLARGLPVTALDNVTDPIKGSSLCMILDQPMWECRVLGASAVRTVSTATLTAATGNNLRFEGDVTRRAIVCRMDAGCEDPHEREFESSPLEDAVRRRPELVVAGLTVLRAYICAGCPDQGLRPLNGFAAWHRHVRSALVWLGEPDPVATQEQVRSSDSTRDALGQLLKTWHEHIGDTWQTARELLGRARSAADLEHGGDSPLLDCLEELRGEEVKSLNAVAVGKWLGARAGRISNGLQLHMRGKPNRPKQFAVLPHSG